MKKVSSVACLILGQTIASGQVLANYGKSHGYLFVMNKERTNNLVLGSDLGSTAYPRWTCQAKKGNKRAEKLCLSLGGKNKYESEELVTNINLNSH